MPSPEQLCRTPADVAARDADALRARLTSAPRIAALRRTGLTAGTPCAELDRIAAIAARLVGAPIALVTLVDEVQQHFPGLFGLDGWAARARGTLLSHSFCQHVVMRGEALVVDDARGHAILGGNAAIDEMGMIAYLGVPLTSPDGYVLGTLCAVERQPRHWSDADEATLRDLSHTVLALLHGREAERRYRLALDATHDAVYSHDIATGVVVREGAVEAIYGRAVGDLPPDTAGWLAVIHPDDRERVCASWEQALAERAPGWECEYRVLHPDGAMRVVRDRARLIVDADGTPCQVAGTLSDVSAQRVAEDMLAASVERWQRLLESAHDGICAVDLAGRVTYANPRLAELLGVPGEVLDGQSYFDWLDPEVAFDARTQFARQQLGRSDTREVPLRRSDGSVVWTNQSASTLRRPDGTVSGVLLLMSDLTAQKATERALEEARDAARASEARFRASFDAMPASMAIIDPESASFVDFNDTACEQLGYTREEFARMRVPDLEDPSQVVEVGALVRASAYAEERLQFRRRHRTRGGDTREVLVTTRPFDATGRRLTYCTWVDITEQVRAEHERALLEEQLRQSQKLQAVGQLAGGIAHDFNNLLTVIAGNAEFLRELDGSAGDDADAADASAAIGEIQSAAERARSLVRQLLTFSRKQPFRPQPVVVGDAVRNAERLLRRLIGEEVALVVDVQDGPATVFVDPTQLEQVLLNLAVNARDAMLTPRHGHEGRGGTLTIATRRGTTADADAAAWHELPAGAYVELVVRDSGHGIDPDTLGRLFEPFFTTKPVGAGTGLGLATVFGIVQQSGGAIRVASAPGEGTTFTIRLPEAAAAASGDARHAPGARITPARPARLLVVEDDPSVRATTRRMLERGGYDVVEASNGAEALERWRERTGPIDLVLSDTRMPVLDGVALAERLQADDPMLPVLLMSGYGEQAVAGASRPRRGFVAKPFTGADLLAAVDALLAARAAGTR